MTPPPAKAGGGREGVPRRELIRKAPLPNPPLPSQGREPKARSMKYLPLIWSELFRRKTRTILTLLSILAALLLFGLPNGVRTSFAEAGQSPNGAERLQNGSRLSFIQTMPISLLPRIRHVDGVRAVTYANWLARKSTRLNSSH